MLGGLSQRLHNVRTLAEAGIIRPARPDRLVRVARALHRFGPTPAAGYEACAARYPHEPGIIDELGVGARLLALEHPRADLHGVEQQLDRVLARVLAPADEAHDRAVLDDESVHGHAVGADGADAGGAKGRCGFHDRSVAG